MNYEYNIFSSTGTASLQSGQELFDFGEISMGTHHDTAALFSEYLRNDTIHEDAALDQNYQPVNCLQNDRLEFFS